MSEEEHGSESESELARAWVEPDTLEREVFEARLRARMFGGDPELPRVDRFVLERMLGAGGMGTVWLARDEALARPVALKLVRSRSAAAGERMRLREARGLARIAHPNVIAVYDVGEHEGRVWLAMEFVPGRTLRECAGEFERDALLRHWIAAGRGLAAIHEAGLVHRDIKPDNVLLGDDGRVRVIDLGLVREAARRGGELVAGRADARASEVVMTPGFVGTRSYAAPEQQRGEPVDARADQYAFCVSVLESLRAAKPTPGREEEPLSASLRDALASGRAPDPGQRFESMTELLDTLERGMAEPRVGGERRERSWGRVAYVGLGLAAVAGVAAVWLLARAPDRAAPSAAWSECIARAVPACEGEAAETIELVLACDGAECRSFTLTPSAALFDSERLPFDIDVDNRTGRAVELRWYAADDVHSGEMRFEPGRRPLAPHWRAADLPVCVEVEGGAAVVELAAACASR